MKELKPMKEGKVHTAIVVTEERVMVVETSVSVPSVDPVSGSER